MGAQKVKGKFMSAGVIQMGSEIRSIESKRQSNHRIGAGRDTGVLCE